MESFQFPPRDFLAPLSPERVNGSTRPLSGVSPSTPASAAGRQEKPSPHASPRRKPANLFADYGANRRSPAKESGMVLPGSPSLPELSVFRAHARTNSDVQGLVKRFEHLDVRDRDAEWEAGRKRHEAELRRAQIAREEAETDVKRLREELRRLKADGDDGRDRERKLGRRIDVVTEDFANFKHAQTSQHAVYEKELRKARKEAFKTSSAVLRLQEELKSTRNTLRTTQSALEMEKRKVAQREQQTFDAQYQLVALQEELHRMKTQLRVVQEERDALKTSLKEEEVARMAAEGMIALPPGHHDDRDLLSPHLKRAAPPNPSQSPLSDDKENVGVVTKKMLEAKQLSEELHRERALREEAQEVAEFLRLECEFQCCSCRSRKDSAHAIIPENSLASALESIRASMRAVLMPPSSDSGPAEHPTTLKREHAEDVDMAEPLASDPPADVPDRSMTMDHELPRTDERSEEAIIDDEEPDEPAEPDEPDAPPPIPTEPQAESKDNGEPTPAPPPTKAHVLPSSPQSPTHPHQQTTPYRPGYVRTITTTTTIPMHFSPQKPRCEPVPDAEHVPAPTPMSPRDRSGSVPTFDREAALAAIAYRRGRARSIANGHVTPRKQMLDGVNPHERRDISAPTLGHKSAAAAARPNLAQGIGSASRTR